jgi:CHASE3 domain sensor protein
MLENHVDDVVRRLEDAVVRRIEQAATRRHELMLEAVESGLRQLLKLLEEHIDTRLEEHAHTQEENQIRRHNIIFKLVEEDGQEQLNAVGEAVGEIESRISELSDRLEEIEKRLKR